MFSVRHLRPYFKFTLPFVSGSQDESIWAEMMSKNVDVESGWDMLRQARASGATLSSWSLDLWHWKTRAEVSVVGGGCLRRVGEEPN